MQQRFHLFIHLSVANAYWWWRRLIMSATQAIPTCSVCCFFNDVEISGQGAGCWSFDSPPPPLVPHVSSSQSFTRWRLQHYCTLFCKTDEKWVDGHIQNKTPLKCVETVQINWGVLKDISNKTKLLSTFWATLYIMFQSHLLSTACASQLNIKYRIPLQSAP